MRFRANFSSRSGEVEMVFMTPNEAVKKPDFAQRTSSLERANLLNRPLRTRTLGGVEGDG